MVYHKILSSDGVSSLTVKTIDHKYNNCIIKRSVPFIQKNFKKPFFLSLEAATMPPKSNIGRKIVFVLSCHSLILSETLTLLKPSNCES